jgi:uncharacterized protein YdaU (DUF1376 family)
MALRDQPYIPLYVQDFMTDEKLIECSASATGVYIRIMCLMHKIERYGTILLLQKDYQTDNNISNFAKKLVKYLPYSEKVIEDGLIELIEEGVLQIDGNILSQKRMIRDNELSIKRSESGKNGMKKRYGKKNDDFVITKQLTKYITKGVTNTEYENENKRKGGVGEKQFKKPTLEEVKQYFHENGYSEQSAITAFEYYEAGGWIDARGKKVRNWKQKMISVWFKQDNKISINAIPTAREVYEKNNREFSF